MWTRKLFNIIVQYCLLKLQLILFTKMKYAVKQFQILPSPSYCIYTCYLLDSIQLARNTFLFQPRQLCTLRFLKRRSRLVLKVLVALKPQFTSVSGCPIRMGSFDQSEKIRKKLESDFTCKRRNDRDRKIRYLHCIDRVNLQPNIIYFK